MPTLFKSSVAQLVTLLLIAILLWLPHGFSDGLTGDAWRYFADAEQGMLFARLVQLARPLMPLAWWLGDSLTPGSPIGINIVAMLFVFGKGALVTLILKQLRAPASLAFAAGALTIVFPADTAIFYLGALAIHCSAFFFMLALYCMIAHYRKPRAISLIGMVAALFITVNIYEVSLLMSLFAPVILLFISARIDKHFWRTTIVWGEVVALRGILSVAFSATSYSYHASLLERSLSIPDMISAVGVIYTRHVWSGWLTSQGDLPGGFVIGAAVIAVIFGGLLFLTHRQQAEAGSSVKLKWLMAGGFVWIGLATCLYLITSDRFSSQRTYYYSAVGAAVLISTCLWVITRAIRQRWLFAIICALLVGLGVLRLWEQHAATIEESAEMQLPIRNIAALLGDIQPGTVVLLVGDWNDSVLRDRLAGSWWYLTPTLQIMYGDHSLAAAYCYPEQSDSWGIDQEHCRLEADKVVVDLFNHRGILIEHPYERVIVLEYTGETLRLVRDLTPWLSDPSSISEVARTYAPESLFDASMTPSFLEAIH